MSDFDDAGTRRTQILHDRRRIGSDGGAIRLSKSLVGNALDKWIEMKVNPATTKYSDASKKEITSRLNRYMHILVDHSKKISKEKNPTAQFHEVTLDDVEEAASRCIDPRIRGVRKIISMICYFLSTAVFSGYIGYLIGQLNVEGYEIFKDRTLYKCIGLSFLLLISPVLYAKCSKWCASIAR